MMFSKTHVKFTVVIPCYNEEKTLRKCVTRVLEVAEERLSIEIIIVDDYSSDQSLSIAKGLESENSEIIVLHHEKNQGKGAALRTGFQRATGDFVAVQDADLEYNPMEFKKLLVPLINNDADVVFGSRFLSGDAHRVLYFWHSLGNKFLTFLSNMFTDINLSDMETCYKVFRRDVIQSIEIEENRFGFEPEIVAKVAQMRLRIVEMGISYYGRTYEEGKKIGAKDGFRAIYCIFRYNAHRAPLPLQFLFYLFIGGSAAVVNIATFFGFIQIGIDTTPALLVAYAIAAVVNYLLCVLLLFHHKSRWKSATEVLLFLLVVCSVGVLDLWSTQFFLSLSISPVKSKVFACIFGLFFNFVGRRFLVFPEPESGPWKPQQ